MNIKQWTHHLRLHAWPHSWSGERLSEVACTAARNNAWVHAWPNSGVVQLASPSGLAALRVRSAQTQAANLLVCMAPGALRTALVAHYASGVLVGCAAQHTGWSARFFAQHLLADAALEPRLSLWWQSARC